MANSIRNLGGRRALVPTTPPLHVEGYRLREGVRGIEKLAMRRRWKMRQPFGMGHDDEQIHYSSVGSLFRFLGWTRGVASLFTIQHIPLPLLLGLIRLVNTLSSHLELKQSVFV